MRGTRRLAISTAAVGLIALTLVGCAGAPLPEFQRAQTARDIVPPHDRDGTVVADSTRLVGNAGAYTAYLARSATDNGICLVVVTTATQEWQSTSCGSGNELGTQLPDGTGFEVGTFTTGYRGARIQVSESVAAIVAER